MNGHVPRNGYYSTQMGVRSELLVCIDLIEKGFEVFRAMSNNSCDLIALKNGRCFRLEVKTSKFGPQAVAFDPHNNDSLVIVNNNLKTIKYYPELEDADGN